MYLAYGEMHSMQHYVIKAGRWFTPGTPISYINKTDRHDITEILLKVALNTITLTPDLYLVMRLIVQKTVFKDV